MYNVYTENMKEHTCLYAHTQSFCSDTISLIVISAIFSFEVPLHNEILFCKNAVYEGFYHTVFTTDYSSRTLYSTLVNFSLFQIIILST